jgi:hypothetical protein
VEQDVSAMLEQAFALIGTSEGPKLPILVPCRLRPIG